MDVARYQHTAMLLPNGQVLVAAGFTLDQSTSSQIPLASAERYNPST